MATYQEPKHIGDVLLVEVKPGWTKDRGTFAQDAGGVYALGTVLAMDDGKYQRYAPEVDDGQSGLEPGPPAIAVAAETVDATAGDAQGLVIARGAVVALDELIWPDGITNLQKADALADLEIRGIVARAQL